MADYKVFYQKEADKVEDTSSGPSSTIWADCPLQDIKMDFAQGYYFEDDFMSQASLSDGDTMSPYGAHVGTGCSIAGQTADVGGVLGLVQDGTDNDEVWIQAGGNVYAPFVISDTAGSDKKLWFEARIKVSSVADDVAAIFCGLGEEAFAADNAKVDDTGVMADKDYIGFNTVHTNGGTTGTNAILTFQYKKSGQTANTLISSLDTLVADTYVKVGFKYDPAAPTTQRIKIYLNGVEQSTYVTGTLIATATFPDGEELAPLLGTKAGTGTASTLEIDWWRCYQLR